MVPASARAHRGTAQTGLVALATLSVNAVVAIVVCAESQHVAPIRPAGSEIGQF